MNTYNKIQLFRNLKSMTRYVLDKDVPFYKKLIIIFVFIYILSPFDIIPDPIFVIGIIDDIVILIIAYNFYKKELSRYERKKINSNNEENIVNNVGYTISNKKDV